MSFSFRNLFNQEGEIPFDDTASANPFSADRTSDQESGVRGKTNSPSTPASNGSLSFTVGELLAFIPPAISAQSGIATEQVVSVPAPTNGLHEIKLSTLYQVCPNLFAAEITPLNDSVIPLPSQENNTVESAPVSPPEQANQSPSENPFWSGNTEQTPPAKEIEPNPAPSTPDNSFSGQGTSPPAMMGFAPATESNPPSPEFKAGLGESLIIGETGQSAFSEHPQQAAPTKPQEAAETPPSASDQTDGFISKENPFLSEPDSPSESDTPNPFDSGPDFSTLFSEQAEAEKAAPKQREIPVRDAAGGVSKFSAHITPTASPETPPLEETPTTEHGIFGKPSTSGFTEAENIEVNDEEDFSAFIPPLAEELTVPDIPALREAEEKKIEISHQSETAEMEKYVFQNAPTSNDPVASTGFVDAISEIPPLDSPAPSFEKENQFSGGFSPPVSAEDLPGQPLEENFISEPQSTQAPASTKFPPIKDELVRDIELRAVFGTNESFTLRKVATLVTCMPGVSACAISTPAQALQASRDEGATIGEEAATLAVTVRELAKLTGSPDAQSFTINTDKGILSIFVSGECYLTVQHDPGEFEPGVQEKLILVSRSLDGIKE